MTVLAAVLLAAAFAFGSRVRTSRTRGDAAPWFALMSASCAGAVWLALAGGWS